MVPVNHTRKEYGEQSEHGAVEVARDIIRGTRQGRIHMESNIRDMAHREQHKRTSLLGTRQNSITQRIQI